MTDNNTPVENVSEEFADAQMYTEAVEAMLPGVQQNIAHTITSEDAAAKKITLSPAPLDPAKVFLGVRGGPSAVYGVDFTINEANELSWEGLEAFDPEVGDGVGLEEGDVLILNYFS